MKFLRNDKVDERCFDKIIFTGNRVYQVDLKLKLVLHVINISVLALAVEKAIVYDPLEELEDPLLKDTAQTELVASVAPLALSLLAVACLLILLIGVHLRKRVLVLVFLIAISILIVLDFGTFVFVLVVGCGWASTVCRFLVLAVDIYKLLVVRSYYYELAEEIAANSP